MMRLLRIAAGVLAATAAAGPASTPAIGMLAGTSAIDHGLHLGRMWTADAKLVAAPPGGAVPMWSLTGAVRGPGHGQLPGLPAAVRGRARRW
jgi:hypothetical protein